MYSVFLIMPSRGRQTNFLPVTYNQTCAVLAGLFLEVAGMHSAYDNCTGQIRRRSFTIKDVNEHADLAMTKPKIAKEGN